MGNGIGEGVGILPGMGAWERVSVGAVIGWPVGVGAELQLDIV